jgi:hypothetical protein
MEKLGRVTVAGFLMLALRQGYLGNWVVAQRPGLFLRSAWHGVVNTAGSVVHCILQGTVRTCHMDF